MISRLRSAIFLALITVCLPAYSQHLTWSTKGHRDATCLYGEITVLATHPAIYYCGANWHPGEPAGGYCGIQHNHPTEKRTIFSIWDTSPTLHPVTTEADSETVVNRFGGEGTGGHTHMPWDWQLGETFQYFVQKVPGHEPDTTDARYYVFDRNKKQWRHSATITSPNGGHKSVTTVTGGLNSFLENFSGRDRDAVKLACYRLWLGTSVDNLQPLTRTAGDGIWGQLGNAYFLAEGNRADLDALFAELEPKYGKPTFGTQGHPLSSISATPLPAALIARLKNLPQAPRLEKK